jgi:FkbM family methyltransferase
LRAIVSIEGQVTSGLQLVRTHLGFDLLLDPADYIGILLERYGIFEVPETDLVTRLVRPGDICIDAGCQVGYYSCLLARSVEETGRVFAFDANPKACSSTRRNLALNGAYSAEVIQAALTDSKGVVSFHVSTDDQTGLSSLGMISPRKETISVPSLRLDAFLVERRLDHIRLLKLDVEGAEEIVLRGLGHCLSNHLVDYILIECFDERLRLLGSSTDKVAVILKSAGYIPWEYGTANDTGWSQTIEVRSRGDCNYLFVSPLVTEKLSHTSLASAVIQGQTQRNQLLSEADQLRYQRDRAQDERDRLHDERDRLHDNVHKLEGDIEWLLTSIKAHEEESARLLANKEELDGILQQIQGSAGWRVLSHWRKLRDRLAPENAWHRKLYDLVLRNLRGGQ